MALPPRPAVTFLFTEIEGYTRLERAVGSGRKARAPFAAALALVLAACGSPVTSAPAAIDAPPQGSLHLTTGPDYDPHDPLRLRYIDANGVVVGQPTTVDADAQVSVDRALPVGQALVVANDKVCDGIVGIQAGMEIDAVLSVADATCTITIAGMHPQGAIAHPEPRTALGAFVMLDSVLVVRPLDPGNAIGPIRKPSDANAEVLDFVVPPGRYELSVVVDGAVLSTKEIDLKRGQGYYYNLRVVAANVPRVCGEIPRAQCEAALTEAYARGLFPPPSSANLTSVRVRPSRFLPCYEAPGFDVLFDVRGEAQPIEVTVGTIPRGFGVCTY